MCENGTEDYVDTVDPRVRVELERLNSATDEINRLEVELDQVRHSFRQLVFDSTVRLDGARAKLGLCVDRAKPYYEARFFANLAYGDSQRAATLYERANSAHSAAREMVYLAEQGLGSRTLDPAWQEMLNHATQRVNDAELDRAQASSDHRSACVKLEAANAKVQYLQKELKRAITKSRPYYEMKAYFNRLLDQQRLKVTQYESQVTASKMTYTDALKNLEIISDEIHHNRQSNSTSQELKTEAIVATPSPETNTIFTPKSATEWTEINLNKSPDTSPNEDSSTTSSSETAKSGDNERKPVGKRKLQKQHTLPAPSEFASIRNRLKIDTHAFSSWKLDWRKSSDNNNSTAQVPTFCGGPGRRQSFDVILGPTSEKVKEILSHGMMMLNINSERRNSEPRLNGNGTEGLDLKRPRSTSSTRKLPSPLEKSMSYLTGGDDDNSDAESVSSVDMLNEEQIQSLMLDKDIDNVCEKLLGTPMADVVLQVPSLDDSSSISSGSK